MVRIRRFGRPPMTTILENRHDSDMRVRVLSNPVSSARAAYRAASKSLSLAAAGEHAGAFWTHIT